MLMSLSFSCRRCDPILLACILVILADSCTLLLAVLSREVVEVLCAYTGVGALSGLPIPAEALLGPHF